MTTTKQKYLVNKTDTNLDCKGGFLIIPRSGYVPISDEDVSDETIKYAVSREWASITTTEPTGGSDQVEVSITPVEPYRGMDESELKEELAKRAAEPVSHGATGTALGSPTEVIISPNPASPDTAETEALVDNMPSAETTKTKKTKEVK